MKLSNPGEPDNRPWCDICGDRVDHVHGWTDLINVYINICDNCHKRHVNKT